MHQRQGMTAAHSGEEIGDLRAAFRTPARPHLNQWTMTAGNDYLDAHRRSETTTGPKTKERRPGHDGRRAGALVRPDRQAEHAATPQ